jgi:hypothetical protein
LCEDYSPNELERIRFAVIKYSEGHLEKLSIAVKLANEDWRDLLIEVGFANDINSHNIWAHSVDEVT